MAYVTKFEYGYCYEDRADIHTSRLKLLGMDTREPGNNERGWLWMSTVDTGGSLAVTFYKDQAGASSVMTGTSDISGIADAPVQVVLAEANSSGLSGEIWVHTHDADVTLNAVLVSLCVDEDLAICFADIDDLPDDVYSASEGLAFHCAAATRNTLLRASQLYSTQLGGHGGPEDRRLTGATRLVPDYRRLSVPDELKEVATFWALELALGSKHERHDETMYSELRDYYKECRNNAIDSWNLTFNLDPSDNDDADTTSNTTTSFPTRL